MFDNFAHDMYILHDATILVLVMNPHVVVALVVEIHVDQCTVLQRREFVLPLLNVLH